MRTYKPWSCALVLVPMIAIAFWIIPSCVDTPTGGAAQQERTAARQQPTPAALPQSLADFVRNKFKQFRLPEEEARAGWGAACGGSSLPYWVQGDFNGDGRLDAALLLVGHVRFGNHFWDVVALHQGAKGFSVLDSFNLDRFEDQPPARSKAFQQYCLRLLPAGAPIIVDGDRLSYTYPLESVALERISNGTRKIERVYAWDPERRVPRRTVLDPLGLEAATQPPPRQVLTIERRGDQRVATFCRPLEAVLKRDFPAYHLPDARDTAEGGWTRYSGSGGGVPWAVSDDYNADGLADAVVILLDESGGKKEWLVVSLMQTDNHGFEARRIDSYRERKVKSGASAEERVEPPPLPQEFGLLTVPAGSKVKGLESPPSTPAVALTRLPLPAATGLRDAVVYEWSDRWNSLSPIHIGATGDEVEESKEGGLD